jgi:peroxiredoxin
MDREEFLAGALAVVSAVASPVPTSRADWDEWSLDITLPFGRPLELDMEFLDMGKRRFRLSDYRGKLVLLNIFTTWCGPCKREQPAFSRVAHQYEGAGIVVIGIDSQEPDDTVRRYRKAQNVTYPIAMDRTQGFTQALGMTKSNEAVSYPTSIFINPSGTLYGVHRGSMEDGEIDYRVATFIAANPKIETPTPQPR